MSSRNTESEFNYQKKKKMTDKVGSLQIWEVTKLILVALYTYFLISCIFLKDTETTCIVP